MRHFGWWVIASIDQLRPVMNKTELMQEHDDSKVVHDGTLASDRHAVRALMTASSARLGVVVLRVAALVLATAEIVGSAILVFDGTSDVGFTDRRRTQWATFVTSVAGPLTFVGLLVAASFVLAIYASRLEMDVVIAVQNESAESDIDGS